ncbi:M16 family metallopeptidase [Microbacterium sp.]|uniref:M16 family metallopeptidase n=1 Tax=Microbacterium sp. TaxID=51671 RepID=UPI003A86C63A
MSAISRVAPLHVRGHQVESRDLRNGSRVLAIHAPRARNHTVALSIGAGMRDEENLAEAGMMHLIEHMVYQDSAATAGRDRQQQLARSGAVLGGHTHMDYTEFYETGSNESIQSVARRLVDQVFFPMFREDQINQQIAAVATERRQRLASAPGQTLPWPHLTGRYWRDHANGHDGSGDTGLTEHATPAVLRSIHGRTYRPQHTVLVALSSQPPEEVVTDLADAVGGIERAEVPRSPRLRPPGQPVSQRLDLVEETKGDRPRRLSVTRAAPSRALSPEVLGDLLVAEALTMQPGIDASAGLFGPGDMTQDDLFVLVDDTAFGMDAAMRLRAVTAVDDMLVRHAVARATSRAEQLTIDDARLVRAVARDVLLRDTIDFATALVDALNSLQDVPGDARQLMSAASARLVEQPSVSLTLRALTERSS